MTILERQLSRAQHRLNTNLLASHVSGWVGLGAAAWVVLLLAERGLGLGVPELGSAGLLAGAALATALVLSAVAWANRLRTAVAIDAAAGLKERLSTAIACQPQRDGFVHAVLRDAEAAAARIHVGTHLPLRAPRHWAWSAGSLGLALAVYLLMPRLDLLAREQKPERVSAEEMVESKQVAMHVNQQLERLQQAAHENPRLGELAEKLGPLPIPERPQATDDVRREALKRIDNARDQVERERSSDAARALQETKRQLARLTPQEGEDPVARLAQSLSRGDLQDASRAAEAIREKAASESLSEAERQQMAELAQRLSELAEQLGKLSDPGALQEAIAKELENKAGLSPDEARQLAEKLRNADPRQLREALAQACQKSGLSQKQLEQLAQRIQQRQDAARQCRSMQQSCQNASQCMAAAAGGSPEMAEGAEQAMAAMLAELAELQMTSASLAELEDLANGLSQMRADVTKTAPPGGSQWGVGHGEGRSTGRKPYKYEAAKAQVQRQRGQITGQLLVDGPGVTADASAELREALVAAVQDAQDAVDRQDIPRVYHGAVAAYFQRLAGLMQEQRSVKPGEAPKQPRPATESKAGEPATGGSDAAPSGTSEEPHP
jgi:hypothetical protein